MNAPKDGLNAGLRSRLLRIAASQNPECGKTVMGRMADRPAPGEHALVLAHRRQLLDR